MIKLRTFIESKAFDDGIVRCYELPILFILPVILNPSLVILREPSIRHPVSAGSVQALSETTYLDVPQDRLRD